MSTATDLNDAEQADIATTTTTTGTTTKTPVADNHLSTLAAPAVTLDPIDKGTGQKELP